VKRDSLVKGTLILALAALVARVIGVLQKVPLVRLLGDAGMASFGIAYNLYFLLLTVATVGMPSALSKLVSERADTGGMAEARQIYRASLAFGAVAGFVLTVLVMAFAPQYAALAGDPEAVPAIRALAPALLLFPMIAMMRGYYQGLRYMTPNGLSQIVEQILRVATAVLLSWLFLEWGYSRPVAVAGASFGGVTGSVGAMAVLVWYAWRIRKADGEAGIAGEKTGPARSAGQIYRLLFSYSIPIILGSLAVPIINFIDSSTAIPLLSGLMDREAAKETLGVLTGRAQSVAGIPVILAIAVSQTALPVISAAFARGDLAEAERRASQAMWLSTVFGVWLALVIAVSAKPLNGFVFGDTEGTAVIVMLTAASVLQIVMMTGTSILNGLGKLKEAAAHVYAGIAVKLAATFALTWWLGIAGVIASTMLCFLTISLLNFRLIRRFVRLDVLAGRRFAFLAAAALTGLAGRGILAACERWIAASGKNWLDYAVQTIVTASATGFVFAVLLFAFGVIGKRETSILPGRLGKLASRFVRS